MKKLTQEILKELIHYCPETGVFTWRERDLKWFRRECDQKTWNTRFSGKKAGCTGDNSCGKKYRFIVVFKIMYLAHRLAWLYMSGSFPKHEIDHVNGNGRDNRFLNIRDVSRSDNHKNTRIPATNTSGLVGVVWDKSRNKWAARIKVNRRHINLGRYEDWFEAVCARKSANLKYNFHPNHGEKRPL